MKKRNIAIAFAVVAIIATVLIAKPHYGKVSIAKKDSVAVPLYEKTDTVRANFTYVAADSTVRFTQGKIILKGFMLKDSTGFKWAGQPQLVAALNSKGDSVKRLIQLMP